MDRKFKGGPQSIWRRGLIEFTKHFSSGRGIASSASRGDVSGSVAYVTCLPPLDLDFKEQGRHDEFMIRLLKS